MKHPFFVGGYYRDRKQGYEVISMSAEGMVVQYDDGTQEKVGLESMQIKVRIYDNILSEFRVNHPVTSDDYFRSLGFLATHARFEAELPNRVVDQFLEQYRRLSGEATSTAHPSVISLGDVDKWGPELRIYFPTPSWKLDFGPDIDIRSGQTDGIKRINNNALWNKLIRLGFRIGKDHDVNMIRDSIPHAQREFFDEGTDG
jgi:hypothetical protein